MSFVTVLYSVVVRALTAQKLHLWSPPTSVHRFWSFLRPCLSKTMVMDPTDSEPDPWADGFDLTFTTNLLRGHDSSCTHWVWSWPADRLPASPWIYLITTNSSNCLSSWLNISCCQWSCPASSQGQPGPALVTLPLAPCSLGEQLPLLLPDSNASFYLIKTILQSRTRCQSLPCSSHKVISSVVGDF